MGKVIAHPKKDEKPDTLELDFIDGGVVLLTRDGEVLTNERCLLLLERARYAILDRVMACPQS